jgi:hypothetical protein
MVTTTLVGPDLALGREILRGLDAEGFPITAALWLLQKERGDWKLVIATPLRDKLGAMGAYDRLNSVLFKEGLNPIDIPIRLEGSRHPLIKALRKIFGKAASVEGMRLGLQSIGGVWIDDAYVYRIKG